MNLHTLLAASSAALCAVLAGVIVTLVPSAGAAATPADVFLSPSGVDSNPCTQAAPCRTLDRGYRVATPGQVVELAGGSYGAQSIALDSSKTSAADVVFREAAGASATLGWTEIRSSHITFEGVHFTEGWRTWNGISDFTFRNTSGARMLMYGTRQVSVLGGDYGPSHNNYSFIATPSRGAGDPGQILIDGVRFHDYTRDSGRHTECLHVAAADGITIRNSRFERCSVMDVFFTLNVNSASAPRNVVLENNFFGATVGGYFSVLFDKDYDANGAAIPWSSVTLRNNSFGQPFTIEAGANSVTNVRVVGNVGEIANCRAGVVHAYNVWKGRSCAATDRNVANVGFVDPAAQDYHLSAGSPAIDSGDPSSYPATDIDGQARPVGGAPDAGADEAGGVTPGPTPDTQAPSTPTGLRVASRTQTSITLGWNASSDDVGVAAYGVYNGATRVGSPTATSYTVTGLACGTTTTLAVDAADAAGNRSGKAGITTATAGCTAPPPAPSDLVAAYSFDEGSGSTLQDRSGNANDGVVAGATWSTAGRNGGALAFDGAADMVTIPDAASLDLTTAMTLEAWIRPTVSTGWRTLLLKEAGSGFAYAVYASSSANRPVGYAGSAKLEGPSPLTAGTWVHLAVTFDGAMLRLYVNGRQVASRSAARMSASSGPLRIGGNTIWANEWFTGSVDDVRVYRRALTAAELNADLGRPVG